MEVAISSLVSSLLSDYVPIASIGVKIALGTLLTRGIEKLLSKNEYFTKITSYALCNRRKRAKTVYVCDWFTARGVEAYLNNNPQNETETKLEWQYDKITIHAGEEVQIVFRNATLQIKKMELGSNKDVSKNNAESKHDAQSAYFSISTTSDIHIIRQFLVYVQTLLPNSLVIHRNSFHIESNDKKNSDEHTEGANNENFGTIFFATLERYFLQSDPIRAAQLGYKGSEIVFGAVTHSFKHSVLVDAFNDCKLEVSLLFTEASKTQSLKKALTTMEQPVCLQFESKELSVAQLGDYTQHIFKKMIVKESELMLQKSVRIHEVELSGPKSGTAQWRSICATTSKTFRNTIVNEIVQKEFIDDLQKFLKAADYYVTRGVPFKRGYLLHGPPGTGKSSLIKAAAREHGLELFVCNLSAVTCTQFNHLISEMNFRTHGQPHILAFEDADRCSLFSARRKQYYSEDDDNEDQDDNNAKKLKNKPVSMEALLNALDGVKEAYGRVVIFTANDSKKFLQPSKKLQALTRCGRIDKMVEVGYCTSLQIKRMYNVFFPSESELDCSQIRSFDKLSPAQLGEIFMQSDANNAMDMIYGNTRFVLDPPENASIDKLEHKHDDDHDGSLYTAQFGRRKCGIKKSSSRQPRETDCTKPLTLLQIKRKQQQLQKKLKHLANVVASGDKAAIDWHTNCKIWLERFNAQDSVYDEMITNFVAPQRKSRSKPKEQEVTILSPAEYPSPC